MDGELGDWNAFFVSMCEILVTIVSSLGETGLNAIYPTDRQNEVQATGDMQLVLLGHEAELTITSGTFSFLESLTSHYQGIKEKIPRKNITEVRNLAKMR